MKTKILLLATIFIYAVVLGGCVSGAQWDKTLTQERQGVKSVSTSMGQRTFDVSQGNLIKAFVNAFSSNNLTVLTLEKDAGFMMAEGKQFLSKGALINIWNERASKFNSQFGNPSFTGYLIPNVNLRVTVSLYEKEKNRTLVKMDFNSVHNGCLVLEGKLLKKVDMEEIACPLPPTMVSRWYQEMWDEIGKSIFMQRETILN
jgi:hypothetical protein